MRIINLAALIVVFGTFEALLTPAGGQAVAATDPGKSALSAPSRATHRRKADNVACNRQAQQGGVVICRSLARGKSVEIWHDGRRVSSGSRIAVMGLARTAPRVVVIRVGTDRNDLWTHTISVTRRDDPKREIDGFDCDKVDARTSAQKAHAARSWRMKQAAFSRFQAPLADGLSFVSPARGPISGRFGPERVYRGVSANGETCTKTSVHRGIDIATPVGHALTAPMAGTVILANDDLYYEGGAIFLDHGWGLVSVFMHLSSVEVEEGQRVARGERLGATGASGRVTGPHLHWGVKWRPEGGGPKGGGKGIYIDPDILLNL